MLRRIYGTSLGVALLVGLFVSPAAAQAPARGRVVVDGASIWREDVSVIATTIRSGSIVDIVGQSERWYLVVIPEALGGRGQRGLIARMQVELLPGSPQPPEMALRGAPPTTAPGTATGTPAPSSVARPAQGQPASNPGDPFSRVFLNVNGAYQLTQNDFGETVTFRANAEDSTFRTAYSVEGAPMFTLSGGAMFSRHFGAGVTVSRLSRSTPTELTADVPHPFFFNTPRPIEGIVPGLRRQEIGFHFHVQALIPVSSRVQVAAFGGPSVFQIEQGIARDFSYTDSYPFDQAAFGGAGAVTIKTSAPGFNAGADVTVFLTEHVGIGVTAMFSRANVDLPVDDSRTATFHAGGFTNGGGLRLRF